MHVSYSQRIGRRAKAAKVVKASDLTSGATTKPKPERTKPAKTAKENTKVTTVVTHGYRLRSVTQNVATRMFSFRDFIERRHNRSGKTNLFIMKFQFFKLPPELRQMIMKLVLVNDDEIKFPRAIVSPPTVTSPSVFDNFSKVFLLNYQFYQEAVPSAYGSNTFSFDSIMALHHFLHPRKNTLKQLRKIALEFDTTVGGTRTYHVKLADLWSLLGPQHHGFRAAVYHKVFNRALELLTRVQQLTVKVVILHNDENCGLEYYSGLFALLFLHQPYPPGRDRFEVEFTVPNRHWVLPPNTRIYATKPLPRCIRKSLVEIRLALLYLNHMLWRLDDLRFRQLTG